MIKNLNKYKFQILLTIIVGVLFCVNYHSGTYLTGWDNLQTELNPGLAVKRAFFSVWEEYQSFGLTAGMAHAADLPRAVFLWIVSFILPENMIRYFYHFLMLFFGGIGMFELLGGGMLAFLGAIFYLLNLGTVQIFYLPFESFSTFFAFLPWGIWSFIKLIKVAGPVANSFPPVLGNQRKAGKIASAQSGTLFSRHPLLFFLIVNLLGTPCFYTQQLFIVYLLVLGCFTLGGFLQSKKIQVFKKAFIGLILILLINSYWLLPQFYFLKTNGRVVSEAKANQLATEEVFYQNYEKGTIGSFLKLEGFYYDLKGINNTPLFAPWKDHYSNFFIGLLPYIFGAIGLLGLLTNIKKKKNLGFVLIYLLCTTALLLATPPFSWINELLRKISFINQIFRSPFTKFIIPYSLVYSYFIAQGIKVILNKERNNFILNTKYFILVILIIFYSLPSFQGYFISPEMKVKIPEDYQSVINYFKAEDKNKRIALAPDYTFWGWFFNKWGYNGSGFLWYGIEQPIVSRTFDVWSQASESYFWESKTAFEAEDVNKILNVFDKYSIDYLILDKSLIPVVSSYKALQYDKINELLMKSPKITSIFEGKNISLYKIDHKYSTKNFINLTSDPKKIIPKINITNDDQAFSENGIYKNSQDSEADIVYPFLSLTSQTNLKDKNWQITEDDNYFYLSSPLTINIDNFDIYLSDLYLETVLLDGQPVNLSLRLEPIIEDKKLIIKIDKILLENFNTTINQKTNFGFSDFNLSQSIGYLVKTQSVNEKGLPLFFYIADETKKQSYLEDRLNNQTDYFILPPRYDYGLGYTFAFQNKSFDNLTASNNLSGLSLYLFPYKALKELKFVRKGLKQSLVSFSDSFEASKINYFTYKVSLNNQIMKQFDNLILYQSYDPGWIAFQNGKILPHVIINNWANGWLLRQGSGAQRVTIIFWPQYLEFLGLILMILIFILVLVV